MKCIKCQHENNANAKFCVKCGFALEAAAPVTAPLKSSNPVCPKCGTGLKAMAKFCVKCGTPVEANKEEGTRLLYEPRNTDNSDRTVVLDMGNMPRAQIQTPPQQRMPIPDVIVPPVEETGKIRKKEKSGGTGLIIAALVLGIAAVAGIGVAAVLVFGGNNFNMGNILKKASADLETETETETDTTKEEQKEKQTEEEKNPLQEMLANQQYTELVDTLLAMEDVEFYGDEDNMREYMRQAVVGHMNAAMNKAEELSSSGDFEGAYAKLDEEISYRNSLNSQGKVHPLAGDQTELEAKREQINSQYTDYVYKKTQEKAQQKDQAGIETLLGQASGRLPEDEYNRISREAYYMFVIKSVDQMQVDKKDPYMIMSFIDSYFEKTNYHGYLMEIWDNQNAQSGRMATWKISVTHKDANGYLLYNSNGRYINKSELGNFSNYELYLARWEIYARHNRIFVDNALNEYYSKYGWYNGTANYANFDESILNEYEKGNIKTIIEYEKECGYR